MNNLQKKIKDMFDKDNNIQHELNSLSSNGLEFEIFDIEFNDKNEYEIKIEKPRVSKSFLTKHNIINLPKLDFSLKNFLIESTDIFELEKSSKSAFASSAEGFNSDYPQSEDIIGELYNDFIKELETQQQNIADLYDTTINASLTFLQESIKKFQTKADSYIEDYINNIAKNRSKIDSVINNFKSSSIKKKVINFFKDRYYNSLILKNYLYQK
jgi:hypothetical protein